MNIFSVLFIQFSGNHRWIVERPRVDTGLRFCSRQLWIVWIFHVYSWIAWIVGVFYELCWWNLIKCANYWRNFMNCMNFWQITNDMHRFSIDFSRLLRKNVIILATLASQRMRNFKIIINNPYSNMVNPSTFLSQFSVAKVYPFCQKTNIIFFLLFSIHNAYL
jgi:hypothetical protein